ncbi:MAG: cytochrome c [Bosea sp.]|uniref:c-type cytochrome n=1 Tax=Bosea sp. (in: a-proteobacteria) TaxID=1871050 RepID=UPI001AC7462E|nr:cytochrome c [Bosea sp. (in: a-proteobacteria)]MBN9453751.1 cytochrome c [Bosea sp. (in: a-proteobacteria)]
MSKSPRIALLAGAAGLAVALVGPLLAQPAPKNHAPAKPPHAAQAAAPVAPAAAPKLGLGREALPAEIKAWSIGVRPDGQGLPPGKGTVRQGDELFQAQCAACHGEFGQGNGRWPVLAGGQGSLKDDRPEKTIGSFWPDLSTVFDYIHRAMPYGNAQSLQPDEVYALTAYLLYLNDIVKDEDFELSDKNFTSIKLPNAAAFYDDDRETTEKAFWGKQPCMKDCKSEVKITGRAAVLDVTPDSKTAPKVD